ncbi:Pol protein [Phytophthora palmivora]|uniref:Pol protein n=1 Tax=Phytophthora palmivora TaxID=4796 RepID=A0A2P4X8M4_9STRA|nr:Pol protein [Phytophthora palmivora]
MIDTLSVSGGRELHAHGVAPARRQGCQTGTAPSQTYHLAPVRDKITGKQAAQLFLDSVFRRYDLPEDYSL